MSLRPPSTSPSPSPGPNDNGRASARQSMGPSSRGAPMAPPSPRPGGQSSARPTSELLGSAGMYQTPEAEALDQWFENLQNYEATLEDMAAASLDVNFKEELSAIEQWFKVLSEAERTAALYSLLQHSTQVQIRFFITVLQQMARSDPMTALLSPAMGGSMQSQMEAKLATLKSPGLKSGLPASPTTRNFSANRQSLALDNTSGFLSPDSAANAPSGEAAATLAQQRAKLKASNAAHRISAPVLNSAGTDRASWAAASSQLSQVSEQNNPVQEVVINSVRPKSSDFSGTIGSPRVDGPSGDSWASMVNTPLIPMFQKESRLAPQTLEAAANKLNDWNSNKNVAPGVPRIQDPPARRLKNNDRDNNQYDDNGNGQHNQQSRGGATGGLRNAGGAGNWGRGRSNGFGDDGNNNTNNLNAMAGLGMQMPAFGMGMGSPGLGMNMPGLAGMAPVSPFGMNMNMLSAMALSPEAQLLLAQQASWLGMQQPMSATMNHRGRNGPPSGKSPLKSSSSAGGSTPKAEDDVDPALLSDIPAWLRSLRLHKYTPNFEGVKWQDMVVMDEAALEAKGVAALGARRKMLKTFELVRKKMGIEGGPPSAPPSAAPAK